jgi:hypothetical protein
MNPLLLLMDPQPVYLSFIPLLLFDGLFFSLILAAWILLRATQPPRPSDRPPLPPDFAPPDPRNPRDP